MKKIIILDIDGVLCFRKKQENLIPIKLGNKIIYLRNGIYELLEHLFNNYQVGIFSSTTEKNAEPILKYILTEEQYNKLLFKWFRDRTKLDPEYINIYDTIKNLQDIIDNPIINENRNININDLLILDDSEKKLRFNNKENYIIVNSDSEYDMKNIINLL